MQNRKGAKEGKRIMCVRNKHGNTSELKVRDEGTGERDKKKV